ncbi:Imm7 family immunity protein [Actinorugispora endophytica]|uniref:Immunity protein 7 of polymorphic toxin system n=1 Tax=Actinorugispora endophytica TaxID=1605990 RepID=A0A4R6V4F2_9ACTN|nr:Imm7 family immunity protein [Actinorugispora endophytica]TDQ53742.1 immunity protein 7 of polymorphic toxin system [Actinorugispora endophytica]
MFQYHAWITIQDSPGDGNDSSLSLAFDSIKKRTEVLREFSGLVDIRWVNGLPMIHLGGFLNRYSSQGEEVFSLLEHTGRVAPGSYGVLYTSDDEGPLHRNEFRVFIMRRGKISEHRDPFLSPITPVIENFE